ncbi:MAG: phosphoribosyl-ATP diphosphatase [Balneolaceae bacterium]
MADSTNRDLLFLYELETLLKSRRKERPRDSYTSALFRKGIDKISQKVGEEAVELVIASKNDDEKETISESADLIFHLLVLLVEKEIPVDAVMRELKKRGR